MHIDKDHLYHGAALTQIAEYGPFKAINALELDGKRLRCAFRINDNIGIYIKYDAVGPTKGRYPEFRFTFSAKNLSEIRGLRDAGVAPIFIVLVCLKAEEICVITEDFFWKLVNLRQKREVLCGETAPDPRPRVREKMVQRLHQQVTEKRSTVRLEENPAPRFSSEDLRVGYREDVRTQAPRWAGASERTASG